MPVEVYGNSGEAHLLPALHSDSGRDSFAPLDLGASWIEKLKGNKRRIAKEMAENLGHALGDTW